MADSFDEAIANLKVPEPSGNSTYDAVNPFQGFLSSAASAAGPEMFGHPAWPEAEAYRQQNPKMGLLSQVASPLADYALALKGVGAIEELPQVSKFLDTTLGSGDSFASGAMRSGAQFAPIEAGRVAGAAVSGGDVKQTAEEGAFDTTAALGLGGIGGALRAGGKTAPSIEKLGLGIDMKDPPQVHYAAMKDSLASGEIDEADQPAARAILGDMKEAILHEELPKDGKYVNDLVDGDAQPINRLFKASTPLENNKSDVVIKRFVPSSRDFPDATSAEEALSASGVSDHLDAVQFPRMVAFNSKNGAKSVESEIQNNLTPIGSNEFLGKEPDGLYVYAKKLIGEVDSASPDDRWFMAKTSDPNRFSENADWAKKIDDKNAWLADKPIVADPANPKDLLDEATNMYNSMPMKGYYQATSGKSAAAGIDAIAEKLGYGGESEIGARLKSVLRETFAPAMNEYRNNPRAQYLWAQARNIFQKADAITHAMTFGDAELAAGTNVWSKLMKGTERTGKFGTDSSFSKIIDGLSKDDFADVNKAWTMQLPPDSLDTAVANRIISQGAADALKKIDKLDEYLIKQTKATQEAVGEGEFSPIKGHYLLPRTWDGSWRVPIYSDTNKLVYMASGKSKTAAEAMAKGILDNNEVKGWYGKDPFLADSERDASLANQVRVGSPEYLTASQLRANLNRPTGMPKSFEVRTGVQGYKSDYTKAELIDKFQNNVQQRNRYLARLAVNKTLGPELTKLGITDKRTFESVMRRVESMQGRQGTVNKAINDTVDRVFAPALGKNSASTMARTVNRVMGHLTIGAGNVQRPVIDMMNFMQTVLPRIAFTMKASDSSLHSAYSWLPVIDRSGMVKGSMGWLEPLRIMKQSFKEMANPSAELASHLDQALHQATIDEFIGHNSAQAVTIKKLLAGEQGYGKFLEHISSYLPTQAWKLSRANAFVVGHIVGRGLNLTGDGLFRFAKEFTEKTMYSYATADKPRLFTGPAGSVFGQFKNWTAHYVANMMEYAGEGYNYNNWSPLMWQMGGTTALGGVGATALMPIGQGLSQLLTNKSLMENLYQKMGGGSGNDTTGNMTDAVYMGLPAFLGLSLTSGVHDPSVDPSRDAAMMFSFVQMNRAVALGKAMGMAWDNYKMTGQHPVDSQSTRDLLVQALAPKSIQRIMSQTSDDGIKSLNNGNRIIGGLNLAEKMMYDAGFMPKRIALAHDINEQLWQEQKEMQKQIQTMGRLWHDAEANDAYDVLTSLNKQAMFSGIPIDRVIASAKAQERKGATDELQRLKPQDVLRFQNLNIVGQ